jgi:hypothetical protein
MSSGGVHLVTECPHGHGPMQPKYARTSSGMGTKPRIVRICYACDTCGIRETRSKNEDELTSAERQVWEKL